MKLNATVEINSRTHDRLMALALTMHRLGHVVEYAQVRANVLGPFEADYPDGPLLGVFSIRPAEATK